MPFRLTKLSQNMIEDRNIIQKSRCYLKARLFRDRSIYAEQPLRKHVH